MLDEFRSTNITWDKAASRIYSPVTANESDENGRKLVVQIVNSGQVEDLTGATLHLYWETRDKLHDGLDVFKAVDLKKGEFELSYTTGMLSNKGVLNANLVLVDAVGRVVSERFKITVTEGIDNDAIQSENSFSSLTQALIDISNLEQNYAPRLNNLTAQLQQTEQQLSSQLAEKANKDEVTNVLTPKGSSLYASLPPVGNAIGDYYYSSDGNGTDGKGNYVWNGTSWYFGGTGDEGYNLVKTNLDAYQDYLGVKNLYSPTYPNGTLNPQTFNGITVTNNYDGTLLINGTVTDEVFYTIGNITLKPGTYTLTGVPTSGITVGSGICNLQLMDGITIVKEITVSTQSDTFTVVAEKTYSLRLRANVGVVLANALFKPMIRLFGDATFIKKTKTNAELEKELVDTSSLLKASFETYENFIGVKNLYSPTYPNEALNPQTFSGITVTNNYDGTLLVNGTVTDEVYYSFGNITLKPGTYTLTGIPGSGIAVGAGICNLQLMDGITIVKEIKVSVQSATFTLTTEKTMPLRLRITVGAVLTNALFKPMIRAFGDGTFIKKTKTNLELEQALSETNSLIKSLDNALYGKEIVWFGTSIPAGGYLGKDVTRNYPTFIANKFGAIVHNEAIGSSPAHCRDLQFVSAENPHGFNLGTFNAVSRCLSNTQAQMQWVIDHWTDDIWGSKPATLSETDKTNILNGSYEVILDKYLTANTFPDLFVFDHGYNDYIYPDNLFDANYVGHEFEPFTYNGAMNFLIRRIYNYNPNAKIVIIGNYDYQTRGGLTVQAQEKVAKRWGIPMFETYKHTGISSEQVYTSFTWTVNGSVYKQTAVASHLETMRNILLPDGVHPHSRPDDLMINRMANAIGNWLSRDITFD